MTTGAHIPLQAGTEAPDFSLRSTSGETVTLSSLRGSRHVLLAFFPKAFTSVCTSQLCAFTDDFDGFSSANVEVLPISVDAVDVLKEFRDQHGMKVQLLSDVDKQAASAYGVLWGDGAIANRAYFLIDTSGTIRWAHAEEHPGLKRENAEIFEIIRSVTS